MVAKFLEKYPDIETKDEIRDFNESQRIAIYRRNNGVCQNPNCGIKVPFDDFHADHVDPHSRGGKTIVSNGQVLCSSCNTRKKNKLNCGY